MEPSFGRICFALAGVDALSATWVGARVGSYPGFLGLPGARSLFLGCLGTLAIYAAIALAMSRRQGVLPARVLRLALYAGTGAAVWMSLELLVERFAPLHAALNGPVVLLAMLVMFSAWGWVAYAGRRAGLGALASLTVAAWSAVVTMTLGVCFGVLLELYVAPIALESMRHWPEFQRSGWSDVGAFSLANTMESAISHMVVGPVVAIAFGALGLLMASTTGRQLQRLVTGR